MLALDNPTVLVITDRNDLDDQLFDTFAASTQLLRQEADWHPFGQQAVESFIAGQQVAGVGGS